MPGRRLSAQEARLLRFWQDTPVGWDVPMLRSIGVEGGTGLRGIAGLFIPFRYPITAVCGSNGVGKSTILALAVLAHHSPNDWEAEWLTQIRRGVQPDVERQRYRFSDFFVRGPGDGPIDDLTITWRYEAAGRELSTIFQKRGHRWGRYSARPVRAVAFLPLSRVLPAYEVAAIRSTFGRDVPHAAVDQLSEGFRRWLSYIMGREYREAEIQAGRKHSFHRCRTDAFYTAFNMGSGEACMISLLHMLQRLPRGGLLVVEEIETGLHPQAQQRLAQVLVEICLEKKVQIVCSTHSEIFLDSLPRSARLLLRKAAGEHSVVESPSTRFAVYEMTGVVRPELLIYCEDSIAATLIEEALSPEVIRRITIREVGSDAAVIRQGVSHRRSGFPMRELCVLDGDCQESDVENWMRSETAGRIELRPDYIKLPGDGFPPERWVIREVSVDVYRERFAEQFACTLQDATAHFQALEVELDHHNLGFALHQRTNLSVQDCVRRTMRAVAPLHPQLDGLRERISKLLES